ncbi:MAG: caspase family protein [Deltaproteobacteria bacterium]|nr:caspase family protein [Deltaproteobacteria bacterium]
MKRAAAIVLLLLTAAPAEAASYALVIGYNAPPDGQKDLATLRYADDDALRYAAHFQSFTDKTHLLSVLDEETQHRSPSAAEETSAPTWKAIDLALADLKKRMDGDSEAVFYFAYSGHGAKDARGNYFLTLKDGAITQQALYDRIVAGVPAKYHHLIIDACHAEAIVGARGMFDKDKKEKTAKVSPIEPQSFTQGTYRERYQSVGTIVGTTIDHETHEWSKIQGGVFSHAVLSALSGAADVNLDGRIEYSELHAFVASATRTFSDPRNRPRVVAMPPRTNMHAALLDRQAPQRGFALSGVASALGHFFIELSNGQRVLDAHVTGDFFMRLVLPDGVLAYLRTDDFEAEIDGRTGSALSFSDLRLKRRTQTARGSLEADYRTAFFAAPFGVSYYRGFVDSAGVASVDFSLTAEAPPMLPSPAPREAKAKKPKIVPAAQGWPVENPTSVSPVITPVTPVEPAATVATARPNGARKSAAIACFVLASVFTAASVGSGLGMIAAANDFAATNLQRPAYAAADRYEASRAFAGLFGALAAGGFISGFAVYPYARASDATAATGAAVSFSGRF